MTQDNQQTVRSQSSRRSVLKAGGAATLASLVGFSGSAVAQDGGGNGGNGGGNQGGMSGWMFNDEARPGAIFRVQSPALEGQPNIQAGASEVLGNATARVVEYFNTAEQAVLFLPSDVQVEQGTIYELNPSMQFAQGGSAEGLVQVQFQQLADQDFAFDLQDENIEITDGGGEGAVRPRNFSGGAIFQIQSEPQGWVPEDVEGSGIFTSYNTRHASYIGLDDEFLFFPQEDADVTVGGLYTVQEEWELVDPAGNLVAVQFDRVDESSIPVDDQYL